MKILSVLFVLTINLVARTSFAGVDCKSDFYSRLNDGRIVKEEIKVVPSSTFKDQFISKDKNSLFKFEGDIDSNDWTFVRVYENDERLYSASYQNLSRSELYRNFGLNRESFLKLKENMVIGFSIVCRM